MSFMGKSRPAVKTSVPAGWSAIRPGTGHHTVAIRAADERRRKRACDRTAAGAGDARTRPWYRVLSSRARTMSSPTDTDRRHLARAIELAEGGRGRVSPNPLVGAVIGRHDEVLGEGFHQALGAAARRDRGDPRRRGTRPGRRHPVRVARAVLPPGPDAAVHRRDPGGRDRAARGRLGRPERARLRPRSRHPARRGHRGRGRRRRARDPGPPAQPVVPQARPHGPAVGAVQVRDDARRQGRHARRATRSGSRASRAASSPTAGGPSAMRSRSGSAPRSPTIRS